MRMNLRARALAAVGALACALAGCTTNPATGERTLALMPWDWEQSVAAQAGPEFTQEFGGATPDAQVQAYVDEVGRQLTAAALEQAHTDVPELEWDYTLLDSEVINAFALPGGKVYLSRGLAAHLENEAQMAGIIGHEIGHVMARHGNQRVTKQIGFNAAMAALAVGIGAADEESDVRAYGQYALPAMAVGGNLVLLSYGRDEEIEADALGMQYMAASGWDPAAQREVMEVLAREAAGAGRPPEWMSTHPTSETRIRRINRLIEQKYSDGRDFQRNPEAYQRRMLARLAQLPPPRQKISDLQQSSAIDVANPVAWCAHCAEEAKSIASR